MTSPETSEIRVLMRVPKHLAVQCSVLNKKIIAGEDNKTCKSFFKFYNDLNIATHSTQK